MCVCVCACVCVVVVAGGGGGGGGGGGLLLLWLFDWFVIAVVVGWLFVCCHCFLKTCTRGKALAKDLKFAEVRSGCTGIQGTNTPLQVLERLKGSPTLSPRPQTAR